MQAFALIESRAQATVENSSFPFLGGIGRFVPNRRLGDLTDMHEAYAEGNEPGPKEILEAMTRTISLANLMDGQIAALRHWAKGRAREAASRITPSRNSRRIAEAN